MLSFNKITIEDKDIISSFTLNSNYQNCDFAFANMCSWQFLYDSEYAVSDGFLFIRFFIEDKKRLAYMFPIGHGDLKYAIDSIEEDAKMMGYPLLILGITQESKGKIEKMTPGKFTYLQERNYFDYIYLHEDLSTLKGKIFQAKRNHVNKFKKLYSYTYLPITPDIIPQCMAVEQIWCKANLNEDDEEALAYENRSMLFSMENFDRLGLTGGAILVDGKIIAFTYGSPVNKNTFGIHVEKADINYEGIFSVINKEFAMRIPEQYIYINREEDLGLPGLRKSKLSYNPVILLEKNAAVIRRKEPQPPQKSEPLQTPQRGGFGSSHPLPEDREVMISLWQTTFQDSDEFVDLFFNRVYKPENTLVIRKENRIVSALQMIPYEIKTVDGVISAVYICGVCTLALERGKGFMNILMNEAFVVMQQRGYSIATIIPANPWLFDIYRKYGFIYPVNYNNEVFYNNNYPTSPTSQFIPFTNEYFHYFDKKQRERQCAVLHSSYDIENIIRDLKNESGNAWIALQNDIPAGIAFVKPESEQLITIKEILYNNIQVKEELISFSLNLYNAQTAKIRIPATTGCKTHNYGLACIIDKKITDLSNLYMTMMLD